MRTSDVEIAYANGHIPDIPASLPLEEAALAEPDAYLAIEKRMPEHTLDAQIMRPSLRESWVKLPLEDKLVLEFAFITVTKQPYKIVRHFVFQEKIGKTIVNFHEIHVGYVEFIFALVDGKKSVIWNMSINSLGLDILF